MVSGTIARIFVDPRPVDEGGQIPASLLGSIQVFVLASIYFFALLRGAALMLEGFDLLLLLPRVSTLTGVIVLPLLTVLPDATLIFFSGIGPAQDADRRLEIGMGAWAGGTVLVLTVPYFLAVLSGRVPIAQGEPCYGKGRSTLQFSSPSCLSSGVACDGSVRAAASSMLVTCCLCLVAAEVSPLLSFGGAAAVYSRFSGLVGSVLCFIVLILYFWRDLRASSMVPPEAATAAFTSEAANALAVLSAARAVTSAVEARITDSGVRAISKRDMTLRGILQQTGRLGSYDDVVQGAGAAQQERRHSQVVSRGWSYSSQSPSVSLRQSGAVSGTTYDCPSSPSLHLKTCPTSSAPLVGPAAASNAGSRSMEILLHARVRALVRPFFNQFDTDCDGQLDREELHHLCLALGERVRSCDLEAFFNRGNDIRCNESGATVDYEECVNWIAHLLLQDSRMALNQPQASGGTEPWESEGARSARSPRRHQSSAGEQGDAAMPAALQRRSVSSFGSSSTNEEEMAMPASFRDLSPWMQQQRVLRRACWKISAGASLVILFSDPMVDIFYTIGTRMGVPPLYVAFVVAPLAGCSTQLAAARRYPQRKSRKSVSVTLAQLLGSVCLRNSLCLGVGLLCSSAQRLDWRYNAEVCVVFIVQVFMFGVAFRRLHRTVFAAALLFVLPGSIFAIRVLNNASFFTRVESIS